MSRTLEASLLWQVGPEAPKLYYKLQVEGLGGSQLEVATILDEWNALLVSQTPEPKIINLNMPVFFGSRVVGS